MALDDVVRHFTAGPQAWDDLPFEEFLGSKVAVLATEEEAGQPEVVMLAIEFAPGFSVAPHQHPTGHIEVVLEGSLYIGDHLERAGDVRVSPPHESYGPLVAGPDGCKCLEIFSDRRAVLPIVDDPTAAATHAGDANHLKGKLEKLLKL
jgi:anti-sigma factor ChrR (cupin superfamily)